MIALPAPRACIIGFPVAQARSPLIHQFWLNQYGLPGSYERIEVRPGDVAVTLRRLADAGFAGGNVTVPHKEEAFRACDRTTPRAAALGAVNTWWREDSLLVGDNTDGIGFVAHLDQNHPGWNAVPRDILLLGAGGAARGLILPLADARPRSITVTNRSETRLEELLADISGLDLDIPIGGLVWDKRMESLPGFDLVINTTSLGMAGQPPLELPLGVARASTLVADIVYVPLETPLLAAARARGLGTLDGLGMLLHQAAPGFERWFGHRPDISPELRAHIVADLMKPKG
jgi:shikimate dehydrogenase